MSYYTNKEKARTRTTKPTKTDQSQAHETDINVIVGRYFQSGTAPGAKGTPLYGDFTGLPRDYRDMIETARSIERHRGELPKELANLQIADLVEMDGQALKDYLTPAKPQGEEANKQETK